MFKSKRVVVKMSVLVVFYNDLIEFTLKEMNRNDNDYKLKNNI